MNKQPLTIEESTLAVFPEPVPKVVTLAPDNYRTVGDLIKSLEFRNFFFYNNEAEMITARKSMYERICDENGPPEHGVLYIDISKSTILSINVLEYMSVDFSFFTYPSNVISFGSIHDPEHLENVANLPLIVEQVNNV